VNVGAFHAREELAGTPFPGAWVTNVEKDELLAAHAHWEPELQAILQVSIIFFIRCRLLNKVFSVLTNPPDGLSTPLNL
jgi:hypothetical protein